MEKLDIQNIPKFNSPEEEIQFLKNEIEKRNQETKNFEGRITKADHAKDVIREYKSLSSVEIAQPYSGIKEYTKKKLLQGLSEKSSDQKVSQVIALMMDKGVKASFDFIKESKDKEVEDDFHRFLVNYLMISKENNLEKNFSKSDWKALNLRLYEIVMPENVAQDEEKKQLKEFIAAMEHFFVSMLSVSKDQKNKDNDYYVLEIAKPNNSNQVSFFIAIPKEINILFEKTLMTAFPNVKLKVSNEDYNIFSERGFQVGAFAKTTKSSALSLKTYDKLETDSISFIISAFTKLKKEGESGSVQIIVRPAGEEFLKKYSRMYEDLQKGETFKRILDKDNFIKDFFLTFKESQKSKEDEEKKEKTKKREDELATEFVKSKISSTIVDTNIRLIANSESLDRAKSILREISSTFSQYSEVEGNSLLFNNVEGRELNNLIHNYIFRLWNEKESLPLNLKELATIYHLPNYVKNLSQLNKTRAKTSPASQDLPQKGLFLGVNEHNGLKTNIFLPETDRLRHTYIIGQTGTGKSVILKNMIIQDIYNGEGCCFIDPHGEDLLDIMSTIPKERFDDVIYFDPAYVERPMGLNMLEFDEKKPEQKTFVINELLSIFKKLFAESSPESMGPAFDQYFRNSAGLVMEHIESGCTLIDISRVLSDKEYRDYKLSKCKNPLITQFFRNAEATSGEQGFENYVPYITSKFDVFTANEVMRPIIGQEKSSFNISEIMDNKKIFLVNLSKGRLGEANANLLGLILVGKFLMAALGRENPKTKPPFYLYLDEFQNVATPSISAILSEARKYKLSLTLAHQYIKQIPENIKAAVFGNVGTKIVFRISEEDAKTLEGSFAPTFSWSDIMKLENLNAYIAPLIMNYPQTPFNIREDFPPQGKKEVIDTIKELSYLKYGKDKEEIEGEIMTKFNL